MNHRFLIFLELALLMGLLAPVALPQRPPAPAPPPVAPAPPSGGNGPGASTQPGRSATLDPWNSQPTDTKMDFVMFLRGRVATNDGTSLPNDVLLERVCDARVVQQVYATAGGDFSMQLGSRADSFLDASGERPSQYGASAPNNGPESGISRHELMKCELRASASGFLPRVVDLLDLTPTFGGVDLGAIVVQRAVKIEGATLSAIPYKAPGNARKAYERGIEAERKGKLSSARQYFQKATQLYPRFANAWYELGNVWLKEDQNDAARTAYAQAITIDTRFLPAYLSLVSMAYKAENWKDVLDLTRYILDRDPLNYATVPGYILDLDESHYAEAYFYNAFANYHLNRIEEAEKSGLRAEHLDLRSPFPQLHLLLADIFQRKRNYTSAISEMQRYLELVPNARNADEVRKRLASLQNGSLSSNEKADQN